MKELEAGGPSAGLGQLGAAVQASCPHLPSALGPASSFFKPQMFAFLRTAERGTESWKLQIDSGKGRKAKWPTEGSSHQSHLALPGVGTSSLHGPHFLTVLSGGLPDKRRLRFDSFRLLLNPIQTIIRINCVTPSLLCSTSMKRNSGPRPYPINKAD